MKAKFFATVAAAFLAAAPILEAEAKRLGGGSSFGRVAPSGGAKQATPAKPAQQQPASPQGQQAANPAAPAAAGQQAATRSSWMGPIAGLAAGLGLAALASYLGLGEELMILLLIILAVVVVFAIFRMFAARRQAPVGSYGRPAMAKAGYDPQDLGAEARPGSGGYAGSDSHQRTMSRGVEQGGLGGFATGGQAPSFNTDILPSVAPAVSQAEIDQFLQVARDQFMKLQAIWDAADIHALADFCTPTMTRELSHQIAARRGEANHTEVVSLNVEWLGMSDETDDFGKPVDEVRIRFSGLIREDADAAPIDFDEAWTLHRVKSSDTGWQLAGITQLGE